MKIGISGSGSIGKRHIKNAITLGIEKQNILVFEPREDRRNEAKLLGVKLFDNFEEFSKQEFEGAIIASPTSLHAEQSIILAKNNKNLLIEKPIDSDIQKCNLLKEIITDMKLNCLVGYCFRFAEYSVKLKELIKNKVVGQPFHIRGEFSEYLPDWHPYEDYRSFYMAKKSQGGGALLDESHGIDLVRYLFGEVKSVFAKVGNYSDLEISSDDNAYLTVIFKDKIIGHLNFDLVARSPRVFLEINGSEGIIIWDRVDHKIKIYRVKQNKWKTLSFIKTDFLKMYSNQARHFVNCLKGKEKEIINIKDAIKTQKIIDNSFKSSKKNKLININ